MASPNFGVVQTHAMKGMDATEVLYACGCARAYTSTMLTHTGIPQECPDCTKRYLTKKWVAQNEAKAWDSEPGSKFYLGFDAAISNAYSPASVASRPVGIREPSVFDWLDFQVEKVRRRSFAA